MTAGPHSGVSEDVGAAGYWRGSAVLVCCAGTSLCRRCPHVPYTPTATAVEHANRCPADTIGSAGAQQTHAADRKGVARLALRQVSIRPIQRGGESSRLPFPKVSGFGSRPQRSGCPGL